MLEGDSDAVRSKNGLVTAAGSGMGRAGAVRFAKEGASVGVVDIDETAVQAVVAEIEADGGKAVGIVADLTKDDDLRRIVQETANAFGGLDFMWDHVGHPVPASIEGIEMKDFDTAVDLNMRTILVTTEAAIPEMRTRGGGSILHRINVRAAGVDVQQIFDGEIRCGRVYACAGGSARVGEYPRQCRLPGAGRHTDAAGVRRAAISNRPWGWTRRNSSKNAAA